MMASGVVFVKSTRGKILLGPGLPLENCVFISGDKGVRTALSLMKADRRLQVEHTRNKIVEQGKISYGIPKIGEAPKKKRRKKDAIDES